MLGPKHHPVGRVDGMIQHQFVDGIGAAVHGQQSAAPSHAGIQPSQVDLVFFQKLPDRFLPIGKLIRKGLKLLKSPGVMADICGKYFFVPFKQRNLGRC